MQLCMQTEIKLHENVLLYVVQSCKQTSVFWSGYACKRSQEVRFRTFMDANFHVIWFHLWYTGTFDNLLEIEIRHTTARHIVVVVVHLHEFEVRFMYWIWHFQSKNKMSDWDLYSISRSFMFFLCQETTRFSLGDAHVQKFAASVQPHILLILVFAVHSSNDSQVMFFMRIRDILNNLNHYKKQTVHCFVAPMVASCCMLWGWSGAWINYSHGLGTCTGPVSRSWIVYFSGLLPCLLWAILKHDRSRSPGLVLLLFILVGMHVTEPPN